MKVAAIMMVKNETRRIHVTIGSVQCLDGIIVFDTGSDDGTPELIERLSDVPVHVKRGKFVNFSQGYNELLDFADELDYDYYVHMDANDEFVGDKPNPTADAKTFMIERRLKYSPNDVTHFWNARMMKAKSGLRYVGVVHEYLNGCDDLVKSTDFHIFQDRTLDDDKSVVRWSRDRLLLEAEYERDPSDARTVFYLAQTYACIGENALAYEFYERRFRMDGFAEERWFSAMKCGELAQLTNRAWSVSADWYVTAFCLDARAEPLTALASHHLKRSEYHAAYAYAALACKLPFPEHAVLFVEKKPYEYERWHQLGIAAYYVGKSLKSAAVLKEGEDACVKAIEAGCNKKLDESNLVWYVT